MSKTLVEFRWEEETMRIWQFIPMEKNNSIIDMERCAEKALQGHK